MSTSAFDTAETRLGPILIVPFDDPIGRSLQDYGEWAGSEIAFLRQFLFVGACVLDVGANIGTHALEFAEATGPSGRIIAFEPVPALFQRLVQNAARLGMAQIEAHDHACGARPERGYVDLPVPGRPGNHGAGRVGSEGDQDVEIRPIDELRLEACRLVKIDAEGMGAAVLQGAAATLERCRPLVFAECNDVADAHALWFAPELSDYRKYYVETPAYRRDNFLRNGMNIFGHASETALFCMPAGMSERMDCPEGVSLREVSSLDELCTLLLSAPRYGDRSAADRRVFPADVRQLRDELGRARYRERKLLVEIDELRAAQGGQPPGALAVLRRSRLWPLLRPLRRLARRALEGH